jgi:1-deoxy-D-xylulose-5-phosphate synthase
MQSLPIGKGVVRRKGQRVAILSFGSLLDMALDSGDLLGACVVDMRFIKPLDEALIDQLASHYELLVTVEDNAVMGGAGSAVNEYLASCGIPIPIMNLGLPDEFMSHGKREDLLASAGLSAPAIKQSISDRLTLLHGPKRQLS